MPSVDCVKSVNVVRTPRVMQLEGMFDVPPTRRSEVPFSASLPFEERDWSIGLIVGPSGCGKSTIARELFADKLIDGYRWPKDKSIVDAFPRRLKIKEITQLLSSVGFSSPPSWLRPFRVLSNGEQFRVTIARALADQTDMVVCDEFTSVVDRTVAQIGSAAIAKAVRRREQQFVAVSCHYDIIDWLDPDWVYEPAVDAFQWRCLQRHRPEIALTVRRVHRRAWKIFGHHHYLDAGLHRAAACYLGTVKEQPAVFTAVLPFPHAWRPGYREHRTVCLPDFQGVGIGNTMSEFVASLYVADKFYFSTSSHPAMIRHRARAPVWKMHRRPSMVAAPTHGSISSRAKSSRGRITAGFTFVGPPADEATRDALSKAPDALGITESAERIEEILVRFPGATTGLLARKSGLTVSTARNGLNRLIANGRARREGLRHPYSFHPVEPS